MSNIKITFLSTERSKLNSELQCYLNIFNEIFICIEDSKKDFPASVICLDKQTAIKLAKTLRTEINKMEDTNNG